MACPFQADQERVDPWAMCTANFGTEMQADVYTRVNARQMVPACYSSVGEDP
jgi:hypothetical protein